MLDFGKFDKKAYSYLCQDFDEAFYQALLNQESRFLKYTKAVFVFPRRLKHPASSKEWFEKFCTDCMIQSEICEQPEKLTVEKGTIYLAIKQQDVVRVVKAGRNAGLRCGHDFGLIAYNDIPSYEVIDEGITALTIDWKSMGTEAADFVLNDVPVQRYLPTEVEIRSSLYFNY